MILNKHQVKRNISTKKFQNVYRQIDLKYKAVKSAVHYWSMHVTYSQLTLRSFATSLVQWFDRLETGVYPSN